ncbi:MAG: hypothetical protein Q8T11_04710 [Elusimicrobiota bacterium]|nr:hypothetical protein [Elusimicrobiota bacterium]
MALQILLLAAGVAFAAPAPAPKPKAPQRSAEDVLSAGLSRLRQKRSLEMRRAVLGGAEELRDAVAAGSGPERKRLAARLPGMAEEPYDICRDLERCREAPRSLHVEEHFLADDAFRALARPWIKLQEARGKAVKVIVDPGSGVRLELEDLPRWPVVTLSAEPAPTGGFDVVVEDGAEASRAFAVERAEFLSRKP